MKRTYWYWILVIGAALAFSHWRSFASEISYGSLSKSKTELAHEFAKAKPTDELTGTWVCDMYGSESNFQSLKSVHLSSVLSSINRNGVKMEVRRPQEGQLISRLTHEGQVVAYSRCHQEEPLPAAP